MAAPTQLPAFCSAQISHAKLVPASGPSCRLLLLGSPSSNLALNLGSPQFSLKVLIGTALWSECPLPAVPGRNPSPQVMTFGSRALLANSVSLL